jgi:hypothetical protein
MSAINFPDSPTADELFSAAGRTWKYNATTGVWETVASDSIPPAAHAPSHELGGDDELLLDASQVTGGVTEESLEALFTNTLMETI